MIVSFVFFTPDIDSFVRILPRPPLAYLDSSNEQQRVANCDSSDFVNERFFTMAISAYINEAVSRILFTNVFANLQSDLASLEIYGCLSLVEPNNGTAYTEDDYRQKDDWDVRMSDVLLSLVTLTLDLQNQHGIGN